MVNIENNVLKYGLIGKNISYSFSKGYFTEKFVKLGLTDRIYENYDLDKIDEVMSILNDKDIRGLNVTVPYKEAVIPFLTEMHPMALEIGAVNTIAFKDGMKIGHNTDALGFKASLLPHLPKNTKKALILGTGGASKAVIYVLNELDILPTLVSRELSRGDVTYDSLTELQVSQHQLIINCSPVGTYPNIGLKPAIPYNGIGRNHLLYDLVYNPNKTAFLQEGEDRGASICNGIRMLEFQAEAAWNIWQAS